MRKPVVKKTLLASIVLPFLAAPALAQDTSSDGGLSVGDPGDAPLVLAPGASPEGAEVLNNTLFGDWLVSCEAITVTRVACSIVQQLSVAETDRLIVRMVAVPQGEDSAVLLAQVPIGAYLPGGAVYRFDGDDGEQRSMVWQRCLGQLCEAAIPLDSEELAQFEAHDTLLFGYRPDIQAEPIIVALDISEFNTALRAISAAR
ncbi:invasion associated locus B family protein [Alkalilacustris brevis]|uniref:invasion associated locus B family protein n=1 Tax=Alkalilacustris brevis TaxID=2026338 RepID=UPI000E0D06D2|nr:invasion associated locus B family protein [Alkalilacustris brevis]